MKSLILAPLSALALLGCAPAQEAPVVASSKFDGRWTGEAQPDREQCFNMRIEGVIRDGQTDFEMFNVEFVDRLGPLIGTLRAPVDENGRLSGMFMSRGSRVVATRIQFADDVAEGVYSNEYCTAKITLRKG